MESGNDMYINSNYNFNRIPNKTLIVRWHSGSEPKNINIDLKLDEPFKIDVLSDVYLDNFTTYHTAHAKPGFDKPEKSAFVLNINEFNIQSNVAGDEGKRNKIFNNIVIPSDALFMSAGASFDKITRSHKSKKMNFVCSINPTTITKITGSITDLNGGNMFDVNNADMFLAEFVFVARK